MTDLTPSVAQPESETPLVYIVAGEPSGDNLAALLMAALRAKTGDRIRFAGVGGTAMEAQGLRSLFPMRELSLMGLAEVLPHLPRLFRRLKETAADVRALRPDVLVTVDSPGFTMRLVHRLRGAGIPIVHYVAPQVWAWRRRRAQDTARYFDHLMVLLPFEPIFFSTFGLDTTFVGHPVLESGADRGDGAAFRKRHGLTPEEPLVCVLPGSRRSEIRRLLPIFAKTLQRLEEARGRPITAVVPLADTVAEDVAVVCNEWPVRTIMVAGTADKHDAFAASTVALVKSGTVTLELAMAGVPMVVAYRVHPLTAFAVRRLIRVPFVSLVNLLVDRAVVPELLQERCNPTRLADVLGRLLDEKGLRKAQRAGFAEAIANLGGMTPPPSHRAADIVYEIMHGRPVTIESDDPAEEDEAEAEPDDAAEADDRG